MPTYTILQGEEYEENSLTRVVIMGRLQKKIFRVIGHYLCAKGLQAVNKGRQALQYYATQPCGLSLRMLRSLQAPVYEYTNNIHRN